MHLELAALTSLKYLCTTSLVPYLLFRHSEMAAIAAMLLDTIGWKEVFIGLWWRPQEV